MYLLDTHALIWYLSDDKRLPNRSKTIISNDPFDRNLISQTKTENITIITRDGKFSEYYIKLIWK